MYTKTLLYNMCKILLKNKINKCECYQVCKSKRYLFINNTEHYSDSNKNNPNSSEVMEDGMPVEPTTCCMSGCANCVWIDYADKLSKYYRVKYKDGMTKAKEDVLSKISDPNMRAFIISELRSLENSKK